MNYQEIEKLKAVLTKMMKKGCMLMIPAYGAEGRIVSIGSGLIGQIPVTQK